MNVTNDVLAVLKVNDVLENIGGKWDRKAKGHVFDEDPTDRLETVFLTGEIIPPYTAHTGNAYYGDGGFRQCRICLKCLKSIYG